MSFDQVPETIRSLVEQEVDNIIAQYHPLGVLLVGSYSNGIPGPQSDIDLHIVVEDQDWRERGNYFVDGKEIEYFINPVRQIRAYLAEESSLQPHTAHMFAHGYILYERDPVISKLQQESQQRLATVTPLTDIQIELYRYSVDDARKDLYNLRETHLTLGYQITAARLFERLIEICCRYYQTFIDKPIKLLDQLVLLDQEFATMLDQAMNDRFRYDHMEELVNFAETNFLGGKRPDIWTLRGPLQQ